MDEMKKPLVSVLMSLYNEEEWAPKAINSILNQTYKNFELIIVNDGSKDDTLKIIKEFANKDSRIKIVNQKNTGLTKALNNGLKSCKGKYLARMDADNISSPTRLAKQVAFLEKKENKKVAVLGTHRKDIYPNSKKVFKLPTINKDIQKALVKACVISHSSIMIRNNIIQKYKYNPNFRTSQDYELWTRIGKNYELANLKEVLTKAYYREDSITRSKKKWETLKTKTKIHYQAYKNLKCPWWYFIYIIKPLIEIYAPKKIIEWYVRMK